MADTTPVIHVPTLTVLHADDRTPCEHPGGVRCGRSRVTYGTCTCSPGVRMEDASAFGEALFRREHPSAQETADRVARARWVTDAGLTLDDATWTRARGGLLGLMEAAAVASEDACSGELTDLDADERAAYEAALADALVSGYMMALAQVRALPYARNEIVMWATADQARPGTFTDMLIQDTRALAASDGAQ